MRGEGERGGGGGGGGVDCSQKLPERHELHTYNLILAQ